MEVVGTHTRKIRYLLVKLLVPTLHKSSIARIRPMIDFVNENFERRPLVGVEIGVAGGVNANNILETLRIKKLYLVDPYLPYLQDGSLRTSYRDAFPIAKERLSKFGDKIQFILRKSSEAIDDVPDNLDFVYIDGNHTYEFVKSDIELYYPKLRKGGVIGGHDFSAMFLGVCRAVLEFAEKNNVAVYGKLVDWWIVKP